MLAAPTVTVARASPCPDHSVGRDIPRRERAGRGPAAAPAQRPPASRRSFLHGNRLGRGSGRCQASGRAAMVVRAKNFRIPITRLREARMLPQATPVAGPSRHAIRIQFHRPPTALCSRKLPARCVKHSSSAAVLFLAAVFAARPAPGKARRPPGRPEVTLVPLASGSGPDHGDHERRGRPPLPGSPEREGPDLQRGAGQPAAFLDLRVPDLLLRRARVSWASRFIRNTPRTGSSSWITQTPPATRSSRATRPLRATRTWPIRAAASSS